MIITRQKSKDSSYSEIILPSLLKKSLTETPKIGKSYSILKSSNTKPKLTNPKQKLKQKTKTRPKMAK